jgi:hypothetical protein
MAMTGSRGGLMMTRVTFLDTVWRLLPLLLTGCAVVNIWAFVRSWHPQFFWLAVVALLLIVVMVGVHVALPSPFAS